MIKSIEQDSFEQVKISSFFQNDISMKELIIIIRRDRVDLNQINLFVRQTFETYHENKIRDHSLYQAIFHDLFDLKQEHWNVIISITWNVIIVVCYIQEYWFSLARRKKTRAKIMYKTIRTSFHENWIMKQIKYVEKNYRKLFSITVYWKKELLKILLDHQSSQQISSSQQILDQQTNRQQSYFSLSIEFSSSQSHFASMTQSQSSRSFDSTSISISTRIVDQNENDWTMSNNYSKKLALLKKIYKDDDKFDIIDDNFDFKILIFYDKCKRANLLRIAYDENVSIMLRD